MLLENVWQIAGVIHKLKSQKSSSVIHSVPFTEATVGLRFYRKDLIDS